jgi:UDP-glucose 4-epimerase
MENNRTVLVTGGLGYIGSHTAVEFINKGYNVVIVDNLGNSRIEVLDGIESITAVRPNFYKIDITQKEELDRVFKDHPEIDSVIHFAAWKAVGESVNKPLKYYDNNLNGMASVLEAMTNNNCHNLVFSSSCTVYGQPDVLPVTEAAPIKEALSPYGFTKQVCETMIKDVVKSNDDLKTIALRYFNPIGAHESALIGELPLGVPDNLIPFVTQTAYGIREQLSVFGDDYNTEDGTAVRDYIHVTDLAKAHVAAIERLIDNKNNDTFEVFNVGTGKGNSVLEVVNTFEQVTGEKLNYKIVDRRAGDIEKVWADTAFAEKNLGWKAELTLADALKSAWEWEKYIRAED